MVSKLPVQNGTENTVKFNLIVSIQHVTEWIYRFFCIYCKATFQSRWQQSNELTILSYTVYSIHSYYLFTACPRVCFHCICVHFPQMHPPLFFHGGPFNLSVFIFYSLPIFSCIQYPGCVALWHMWHYIYETYVLSLNNRNYIYRSYTTLLYRKIKNKSK